MTHTRIVFDQFLVGLKREKGARQGWTRAAKKSAAVQSLAHGSFHGTRRYAHW
jgi:hypothetical protein